MRAPTIDAYTGMKRCISPYSFTSWMTSRRYAFNVHPKSLRCTPVTRAMTQLATCDGRTDRKSTRLNSSHLVISYAVFCLKKKKSKQQNTTPTPTPHADLPQCM